MITKLPVDLAEEILSRVPLKHMRAVKLTCKKWNALSKTLSFRKLHIGKASDTTKEGESQMIVMMDYNLYLMSVVVNDVDPYTQLKGKLTCLDEQVKISQVFHCEGLLLCILKDDITRYVVWNPYCGQTRWIKPRFSYPPRKGHSFNYALGYENKKYCRSHKFLRFIEHYVDGPDKLWCEIYNFDYDLWKNLDANPNWRIESRDKGVSLKGNTYWCVREKNSGFLGKDYIICFDFTRERFGPLLPLPFKYSDNCLVALSSVGEEKLVVFPNRKYEHIEIWITTKIEVGNMSWSRFLTVDVGSYTYIPFTLLFGSDDGYESLIIDEVKKVAFVIDKCFKSNRVDIIGEAGYVRFSQVDLVEPTDIYIKCQPQVYSYVPSPVQI